MDSGNLVTESLEDEKFFNGSESTAIETIDFNLGIYGTATDIRSESLGFGIPDTIIARRILHYCFGTLLVLIGIAGAVGNGLVIYVFTRYRRLRGGGGRLILSLACGDFMVSAVHFMPAYSSFKETWSFGELGCQAYAALVGLGGMASIVSLAAIASDRFSVIIGSPKPWLSGRKTCLTIWLFCVGLVSPPFFGWSRYVREGLETSCSWDYTTRTWNNRSYYIFLLFFGFVVPVFAMTFSLLGILWVVRKHSHKMNGVTRNGVIHNKKKPTKSDLRTTQVILTIIVVFMTSWTPYAIVSCIGQFGPKSSLSPMSSALPAIFAKASVIYNPIIYGFSHPHFRSAIRMLKLRHFTRNRHGDPYDRYHHRFYPPGSHGKHFGPKTPIMAEHAKYHEERQRMKNRRHGGKFPQPSISQHQQMSDPGTTLRTYECSSDDEVVTNEKGWVVLRRYSPCPESDLTARIVLEQDEIGYDVDSTTYSEPDLVHKDYGIVKLAESIRMCEYRRQKRNFLRKSFFRSETCLENLIKVRVGRKSIREPSRVVLPHKISTIVSLSSSGTKCVASEMNPNARKKYSTDREEWEFNREICTKGIDHSVSCQNFTSPLDTSSSSSSVKAGVEYRNTTSRFTLWKKKSFSTSFSSSDCPGMNGMKPSSAGGAGSSHRQCRKDVIRLRRAQCVRKRRKNPKQLIPIRINSKYNCSDSRQSNFHIVDKEQMVVTPIMYVEPNNTITDYTTTSHFRQNSPAEQTECCESEIALDVVQAVKRNEVTDEIRASKKDNSDVVAGHRRSLNLQDAIKSTNAANRDGTNAMGKMEKSKSFHVTFQSGLTDIQNSSLNFTSLTTDSDKTEFTDSEDSEMDIERVQLMYSRFQSKTNGTPELSKNTAKAQGCESGWFKTVHFYENPYSRYQETSFSTTDSDKIYSKCS